jgi:putative aldouronate transport system permease protein
MIVICGLVAKFTAANGIINDFRALFGAERISMLNHPQYFVPVYIISEIWTTVGWDSIIYLAALTGVDKELYEAACIDGAGRWRQTLHISISGILPTIIIMFILRIGGLLSVGYEKILLLYNPITYETADIITTYLYRRGLVNLDWSYSSAVGLFNSVINFTLLVISNQISRRFESGGLW